MKEMKMGKDRDEERHGKEREEPVQETDWWMGEGAKREEKREGWLSGAHMREEEERKAEDGAQ